MKPAAFSPRRLFVATAVAVFVLAAGGWGLWSLSALEYRRIIDRWIDEGRSAGYQISYDDRQIFGFPRRIVMRIVNLRWKNADGIDFRADDVDIAAAPWDWSHFRARFKSHVSVAAPLDNDGHSLLLAAASGRADVDLDTNGFWRQASVAFAQASLGLTPDYLFQADKLTASAERPAQPPADFSVPGLSLEGEADTLSIPAAMPSPFGASAKKFALRMRVMGPMPDVRRRETVEAWNKAGGIAEFDRFTLDWGVLQIASKGTLGFDDDLQPEGAFVGSIAKPDKALQTLMDQKFIAARDGNMLTSAMNLFAKPSVGGLTGSMDFPITVQLGGLFFGPVRLFTFPEIDWPKAPPPLP